jgi:hypothetical protein
LSLSVEQRLNTVKQHKLCENCLRATHKTESCNSGNCRQCHKRHNSLLHLTENSNQPQELAATSSIVASNSVNMFNKLILLSTALIQVHDRAGKACQLRALLDSGSQSHFITENACHLLKLPTQKINIPVSGINQNITTITRAINIKIKSNHNNFKSILSCLVVGKITDNLPSMSINSSLNIPKNIKLADPTFNQSGQIDLLIGSALFWKLLSIGQIHVNQSGTIIQKTKLGWIVSGPIPQTSSNSVCNVSKMSSLDLQLKRFWEINESHNLNLTNHSKADDELCEQMFEKTTQRDPLSGRFTAKLPFRNNPPNLGHSRELAIKRFKSLENKFFRNSSLQSDYCSFMREYLNLGHMEKINHLHIGTSKAYYLAHHPVIKESSVTTKLRVVFDGSMRQKFWPISGYALTRQITRSCISCRRVKPIPYQQLMGDLPGSRVTPGRPFTCTGVDYAGPYILKNGHGRTNRTIKGYIVIFICLTTRAVHIELVCDCTSSTFLNALKRFMSRRGKVLHIYSDNGTNFSGANRELKELHKLFKSEQFAANVVEPLTNDEIHWHFIPPRSPHMGGLWEAAVKSTKGHLKRVLGNTILNYEEMYTLLTMIEACLNSRPLAPLSNDPSDLEPLTPGHFLIGGPLHTAAEPDVTELPSNRLSRYQLIERLRQHFWKRWSKEILHQFQQRPKWTGKSSNQPEVGTLVVLKEDNVSPLHWPMGRITEVHPGADGLVRVVTVKTANGVLRG